MTVQSQTGLGPVKLSPLVTDHVRGIRGSVPGEEDAGRLTAAIRVHPEIAAGARKILETGANLQKVTDIAFQRRANGAERLAFYVISGLANWESFTAREEIRNEMSDASGPYGGARMDRASGAMSLPPPKWDLLQDAVAEASDAFATNLGEPTNPGKEFMRTAQLKHGFADSPVFKLGCHPAFVKIAAEYLGMHPILLRFNLLLSENNRIQENSSQFPHLDPEDYQQVKIFLYVNDVYDDAGPFQVLRTEASDKVQIKYDYRFGRLSDQQLFDVVSKDDLVVCTGPGGTANFADTSRGFHFGSRPAPRQRMLVMYQYVTPFAASWAIAAKEISAKFRDATVRLAEVTGKPLTREEEYLFGVRR